MVFRRKFSRATVHFGLFLGIVAGLGLIGSVPDAQGAIDSPSIPRVTRAAEGQGAFRVDRIAARGRRGAEVPSTTASLSGAGVRSRLLAFAETRGRNTAPSDSPPLEPSSTGTFSDYPPSFYLIRKEGFWAELGALAALAVWAGVLLWNIRQRKRAEESLRQSEERLRLALEGSRDALWDWDVPTGRLVVDERWCSQLGYAKSELDEHIDQWKSLVHGADLPSVTSLLTECLDDRRAHFSGEFRMWTKCGQWKWILSRGKVVARDREGRPMRLAGTHRDISRDKENERALKDALNETEQAKEKIDCILKSIADGLIVSGLDKKVVLMNPRAESLLGVPFAQSLGRSVDALFDDEPFGTHLQAFLEGKTERGSVDLEMFDQEKRAVRVIQARTCPVCNKEGEGKGMITILQDVTQAREMERIKSEFVATAAHELRTPLTAIMGYADLLLGEEPFGAEERREFTSVIYEKSQELENIVDDLLDLSRIESGRLISLGRTAWDLKNLALPILTQFRKVSPRHRFEFLFPEEEIRVWADKGKVGQVLENLLSNAVKYSPGGGRVCLSAELSEGECRCRVEDEGIGMTPEQTGMVFDKFYRANFADAAVRGLGLGMTIVKSIVEAHGGRVWVESEWGRGTKVTFSLPLRPGPVEGKEERREEGAAWAFPRGEEGEVRVGQHKGLNVSS